MFFCLRPLAAIRGESRRKCFLRGLNTNTKRKRNTKANANRKRKQEMANDANAYGRIPGHARACSARLGMPNTKTKTKTNTRTSPSLLSQEGSIISAHTREDPLPPARKAHLFFPKGLHFAYRCARMQPWSKALFLPDDGTRLAEDALPGLFQKGDKGAAARL